MGFQLLYFCFLKGRVFGISGILGGIVKPVSQDLNWRLMIVLGLVVSGMISYMIFPQAFPERNFSTSRLVVAGLLVGFGTQLGGGCTSGHGVCGISRMSLRSILATVTFILSGILSVYLMGLWEIQ